MRRISNYKLIIKNVDYNIRSKQPNFIDITNAGMGEIPCSIMKNVQYKNLDVLSNIMSEMTNSLKEVGYHQGETVILGKDVKNYMGYNVPNPLNSFTEWWMQYMDDIRKGGQFLVSTKWECPNSDNYHYAAEELYLHSTVLPGQGYLIELRIHEFEDTDENFAHPSIWGESKAYIVRFD